MDHQGILGQIDYLVSKRHSQIHSKSQPSAPCETEQKVQDHWLYLGVGLAVDNLYLFQLQAQVHSKEGAAPIQMAAYRPNCVEVYESTYLAVRPVKTLMPTSQVRDKAFERLPFHFFLHLNPLAVEPPLGLLHDQLP